MEPREQNAENWKQALEFLDLIKARSIDTSPPVLYNSFMEIMKVFNRDRANGHNPNDHHTYAQLVHLFTVYAPDLLEPLKQFMPDPSAQPQATESVLVLPVRRREDVA